MEEPLIDIHKPVTICRASAGTGKTYTLAAYYVGLLLSGEDYRSILAITFTNKATAEMSERILAYLYGISQGRERAFLSYARRFMIRDTQASDGELERRAGDCFRRMLLDYDNVQVQTIDSFLQTLLNGLAGVLRMSAGLNTELDKDHVIRQSVDQLLTTELTPSDKRILEDYMRLKLDNESHWDVRQSLCAMANELYNESVQVLDAQGRILFDAEAVEHRRIALEKQWAANEDVVRLRQLLQTLEGADLSAPNGKAVGAAIENLRMSLEDVQSLKTEYRFRGLTDGQLESAQAGKWTKLPEYVVSTIVEATLLARKCRYLYNTIQLTIRFSRDMELMASLQTIIQRNLAEANCALLARTAGTLTDALRAGDADFILEKAGIRYRHVLIDEFQDTSRLQWSVINQLLMDVLAGAGHTLLIVGDIKQSIYRWRNGDWHIMDELDYPQLNTKFTSLTRNFRSSKQVVDFNLSLFKYIIDHYSNETDNADETEQKLVERIYGEGFKMENLDAFYQSDKKTGGYVRFRAFPKQKQAEEQVDIRQTMTLDMFDAMESLLSRGASPSDMMILVREKKEAAYITDLHAGLDASQYPLLSAAHIVSADSFLLEASEAVRTVIAGLRVLVRNDEVAAAYLQFITGDDAIVGKINARISGKTPLYEAVCELLSLLITNEEGQYKGKETAYINSLLDRTRDYVSAYGSRMADFLTYWDDTLHAKPIPAAATDAVRILTVHASKGLQAQTLFVPFCMWTKEAGKHPQKIWCEIADGISEDRDFVPIQDGPEMVDSAYCAEYKAEHLNMRIDNLNMLYVALTRAEDNLYISTSYPVTGKGEKGAFNHVGRYLLDFIGEDEYEAGEPVIKQVRRDACAEDKDKPFSFSGTPATYAELWANSDSVRFVQSQEGALYTDYGEESYRRVARMDFGNLCHEIFAHLRKADELEQVLDDFESRGEIASKEQRNELKSLISSAWEGSDEMRDWFTSPWQLKLEEAIYMDHRELRPDRVMINPQTNEAIVLDYKFGQWEDKYTRQVHEYKEALRRMGYQRVRGYLWFARKPIGKQLIEVYG